MTGPRPQRKSLGKKLRFEVFKRDEFTCSYCGAKPPTVVLQVDHVVPIFEGGTDAIENLTTSCFDCNSGKSRHALSVLPQTVRNRADLLAEREEQEREFAKILKARRKRQETVIDSIEQILLTGTDLVFKDRFRISVKNFLDRMPFDRVILAAELAYSRIEQPEQRLKYFCGICWKFIREGSNARA